MQGFKQVMTADDLLGGKAFPGKKIVIVGGGTVGCETADYLAPLVNDLSPANRDVTVIEMTKTLAANEGGAGRAVLITRMLSKGVHVLTEAKVTEITEDTISYEKDGEVHTITGADTLVLAMGYRPDTKLADDLAAAGVPPTCWAMPTSAATSATHRRWLQGRLRTVGSWQIGERPPCSGSSDSQSKKAPRHMDCRGAFCLVVCWGSVRPVGLITGPRSP